MAPPDMAVAVALFEKGFPPERVEAALKQCSTLEEAVAWLSAGGSASSGSSGGGDQQPPSELAARLRVRRAKKGPASPVAAAPEAAKAQAPAVESVASAAGPVAPQGMRVQPQPVIVKSLPPKVAKVKPTSPSVPLVAIEPRNASDWWREAASRFPQITNRLRIRAAEFVTRHVAGAGQTASSEAQSRKRPNEATSSNAEPASRKPRLSAGGLDRPPATPVRAGTQVREAATLSPMAMELNKELVSCSICCDDVKPGHATMLGCMHGWYCEDCMQRHADARLDSGATTVPCPECGTALAERQLRKLLPVTTVDKLLARSLEQTANLFACPTPNCPMRVDLEEGAIPRLECPMCSKVSCVRCGAQPYHGKLTCEEHAKRLKAKREKAREEKNRDKDGNDALLQWMKQTGSKQCPSCRIVVTKQNLDKQNTQYSECHKMMCRNCNTKFCFKCLTILTDKTTCGCSIDAHGFINPLTGKRNGHGKGSTKLTRSRG
eukprot:gnl/TRDRNA2_/TRDRNA2_187439_c0_seq1.p1 gnl/TRDRNA2_/TRDRNA2_187439_c0~~gnl/TRDRNA2_/TRDRNA2_187439_c0_seq1.p1  ORF type:complete len:515 (-),score=95.34 gnl/TRDRNA2_/TRDRNA2_187439_c0_seq1:177-1652(-)